MTHYIQVGACPVCGAPLFATMTDPTTGVALYDATSGLWSAIPTITYTCATITRNWRWPPARKKRISYDAAPTPTTLAAVR